jgi:hypothetical protein
MFLFFYTVYDEIEQTTKSKEDFEFF